MYLLIYLSDQSLPVRRRQITEPSKITLFNDYVNISFLILQINYRKYTVIKIKNIIVNHLYSIFVNLTKKDQNLTH